MSKMAISGVREYREPGKDSNPRPSRPPDIPDAPEKTKFSIPKRGRILITALMLTLMFGCRPAGDRVPTIRYGEEACAYCRMLINEARFASAYETNQGEMKKFDDIGCLVLDYAQHRDQVTRIWVHDYTQDRWLKAQEAVYVQSKKLVSPMGYGIAATATQESADALAKQVNGRTLRFEQLGDALKTRNP